MSDLQMQNMRSQPSRKSQWWFWWLQKLPWLGMTTAWLWYDDDTCTVCLLQSYPVSKAYEIQTSVTYPLSKRRESCPLQQFSNGLATEKFRLQPTLTYQGTWCNPRKKTVGQAELVAWKKRHTKHSPQQHVRVRFCSFFCYCEMAFGKGPHIWQWQ